MRRAVGGIGVDEALVGQVLDHTQGRRLVGAVTRDNYQTSRVIERTWASVSLDRPEPGE